MKRNKMQNTQLCNVTAYPLSLLVQKWPKPSVIVTLHVLAHEYPELREAGGLQQLDPEVRLLVDQAARAVPGRDPRDGRDSRHGENLREQGGPQAKRKVPFPLHHPTTRPRGLLEELRGLVQEVLSSLVRHGAVSGWYLIEYGLLQHQNAIS